MLRRINIYEKFIFFINLVLLAIIKIIPNKIKNDKILIVRLDKLGDYILFRNFIEEIAKSKKYFGYEIYLCGNEDWKDLSFFLDNAYINDFIWINKRKFKNNIFYKFVKLFKIKQNGFSISIESTFAREHSFGDLIIAASEAKLRIGRSGDPFNTKEWKRKLIYNKFYTNIIVDTKSRTFEFYRNKYFFEKLLDEKIEFEKPFIKIETKVLPTYSQKYILISPGAGNIKRQFPQKHFSILIDKILKLTNHHIILIGSINEIEIGEKILERSKNSDKINNLIGKTNTVDLIQLIKGSDLVITNDNGIYHMTAALNKKFICISNGNNYKRFIPYPKKMNIRGAYLFPQNFIKNIEKNSGIFSIGNIAEIEVDNIIRKISFLLKFDSSN